MLWWARNSSTSRPVFEDEAELQPVLAQVVEHRQRVVEEVEVVRLLPGLVISTAAS